jgi:hypothetical protein
VGYEKSKVFVEPRAGVKWGAGWWELPCQLRAGANLDDLVGSGMAEELKFGNVMEGWR